MVVVAWTMSPLHSGDLENQDAGIMRNRTCFLPALIVVLAACGPSASDSPGASPSATAVESTPAASGEPSASAEPAPTPARSAELPAYICGLEITSPASIGIAHTADVRVGTHSGYDRVVFEYLEAGTPAFRIGRASPPFTKDPSGLPMAVNGSNVLEIVLNGGTKVADDGSPTYTGPTNFEAAYPQLVHLVERGDFEGVNTWYLGLDGGECLRAYVLSDPSRIVIDIQH
jgi:hypothetical protein